MLEKLLQFVLKLLPKPLKSFWDKNEHALRYCYYGAWTTVLSMLTKFIGKWLFFLHISLYFPTFAQQNLSNNTM